MRKKISLAFVALSGLVCIAFALQSVNASAGNLSESYTEVDFNSNSILVIYGTESLEEQEALWEEWLTNPDIEEIVVLDPNLMTD